MKNINYFLASLYFYFKKKGIDIPHFRTMVSVVFILFLNLCSLALIFNIPVRYFIIWNTSGTKSQQWIGGMIYFISLIFIFSLLFSEAKLKIINVTDTSIKKVSRFFLWYFIFSFLILMLLILRKGLIEGYIDL